MANFTRELDELVANKVITPEVADNIRVYYDKPAPESNRLVIAFGVIGALLVGMGIVLIIAHNWDDLSTAAKLFVGLAPLAICQVLGGVLVFKQSTSKAWTESVAVMLVFAVATSISIVSQVYNISGNFSKFLLVWCALSLPIVYVLRSWMASLLYWIGITWYVTEARGFLFSSHNYDNYYWFLALAGLPFYINLIRKLPNSNSISFHNWIIAISLATAIGLVKVGAGEEMMLGAIITLFSIYILIGQLPFFAERKLISNAWLVGGSAGTIITLLVLTFEWPGSLADNPGDWWLSKPLAIWGAVFLLACWLLYEVAKTNGFKNVLSKSYTFLVFVLLFVIGIWEPNISRALTNILLLALGVYTIREGALANQLWKMNYGLLILSILIMCRFFDTDMSFVIRGLLFVMIGAGFFGMNYYMAKKRRAVQ